MENSELKKNVLFTGITGLVGSFLARYFLDKGYTITALVRTTSDCSLIDDIKEHIQFFYADILDIEAMEPAFNHIEMVIHCAGFVSFHKKDEDKLFEINVKGTANIVNLCLRNNISQLCYISSVATLGRPFNRNSIDESIKWKTSEGKSNYAISKYLAELEIWRAKEEGLNVFVFNPSVVLGPGNPESSSTQIFKYIRKGIRFYPPGSINIVDVRDLAEVITRVIEEDIQGQNLIVNAGQVSYKVLFQQVANSFNQKEPYLKLPQGAIHIFYWLVKPFNFLLGEENKISSEIIGLAKKAYTYDNSRLLQKLSFRFRPVNETIKWTCEELMKRTNI